MASRWLRPAWRKEHVGEGQHQRPAPARDDAPDLACTALYARLGCDIDKHVICQTLQNLSLGGYIEHAGATRFGSWRVTSACKIPRGEDAPFWIDESSGDDEWKPAQRAVVTMPIAPASVFNLALHLHGLGAHGAAS